MFPQGPAVPVKAGQAASLYAGFFTSLGQLLILNHWMACAWFGVRWLHPNDNWVVKSGMNQNYWTHQYLMCMLWSFCQLGVGESPLQPTNTTEMLLNCVIAFRALITTATLISTMSDLIAGLRSLREDEAAQFRLLRRFLAQNNIPHDVSHKVTQFLQHQFTNAQKARPWHDQNLYRHVAKHTYMIIHAHSHVML